MTTREEQTRRRGSSFRGQLEQEIKVRLASSTKVSAPNSTPRAQGRWWEERWHPSPLFLPTPPTHPHDTEAHQHHSGSLGLECEWLGALSFHSRWHSPSPSVLPWDPTGWVQPDQGDPGPGPEGYHSTAAWLYLTASCSPTLQDPQLPTWPGSLYGLCRVWDGHMSRNAKFVSATLP